MLDFILNRVTPRELASPGPDERQLQLALAAAQAAPDHGRLRPWRFIIIRAGQRARLGDVMVTSLRFREPEASAEMLAKEAEKPLRAPLIVVVACVPVASPKIPVEEQIMAASAAAQNFQLALHAQGFGCQWKTGPAARDPGVRTALGLGADDRIIGFMYVGTIAAPGRARDTASDRVAEWD